MPIGFGLWSLGSGYSNEGPRVPWRGVAVGVLGLSALALLLTSSVLSAQDGLYTSEQADTGRVLYEDRCVECHGALEDITPGMAALLGDRSFRDGWNGRPLGELFGLILETMPQDDPGTLSPAETAEIVAYILSGNRFPPGEETLSSDIDTLMGMPFER